MTGGRPTDKSGLASLDAAMEDNRSDTVVVLASYTEPTRAMVGMNPSPASRIGRTIWFPDLSATELTVIFGGLAVNEPDGAG